MYSLFKISYVGGGYERSIHSVLEPLFSNCFVITGPAIERSTEYDLCHGLVSSEIHVLNNTESFYTIIESINVNSMNLNARADFSSRTTIEMKEIFHEILKD